MYVCVCACVHSKGALKGASMGQTCSHSVAQTASRMQHKKRNPLTGMLVFSTKLPQAPPGTPLRSEEDLESLSDNEELRRKFLTLHLLTAYGVCVCARAMTGYGRFEEVDMCSCREGWEFVYFWPLLYKSDLDLWVGAYSCPSAPGITQRT